MATTYPRCGGNDMWQARMWQKWHKRREAEKAPRFLKPEHALRIAGKEGLALSRRKAKRIEPGKALRG